MGGKGGSRGGRGGRGSGHRSQHGGNNGHRSQHGGRGSDRDRSPRSLRGAASSGGRSRSPRDDGKRRRDGGDRSPRDRDRARDDGKRARGSGAERPAAPPAKPQQRGAKRGRGGEPAPPSVADALEKSDAEIGRLEGELEDRTRAHARETEAEAAGNERIDGELAELEKRRRALEAERGALKVRVIEADRDREKCARELDVERKARGELAAALPPRAPSPPPRKRDRADTDLECAPARRPRVDASPGAATPAAGATPAAPAAAPRRAASTSKRAPPRADRVVEASRRGGMQKIRDVFVEGDGSLLLATIKGDVGRVARDASTDDEDAEESRVAFAPDVAWFDGWEPTTSTSVAAAAYSGSDVVLAYGDRGLDVVDAATGARTACLETSFRKGASAVAWLPGGAGLVAGGHDHEVVFARHTGGAWRFVHALGSPHTAKVSCVGCFDDATAMSGGVDCRLALYDLHEGRQTMAPELYGSFSERRRKFHALRRVPRSEDVLAVASQPYDLVSEEKYKVDFLDRRCQRVLPGLEASAAKYSEFCEPRFSDDGVYVSLGSCDGAVKIWDLRRLQGKDRPMESHAVPHGEVLVDRAAVSHATLLQHGPRGVTFAAACASRLVVRAWRPEPASPAPRPRAKTR